MRKGLLAVFGLIVLAGVAWWAGTSMGNRLGEQNKAEHFKRQQATTENFLNKNEVIKVGAKWPDAALQSLDGEWRRVSELLVDTTLLMIVMPGCDACETELDAIANLLTEPQVAKRVVMISSAYPLDMVQVRDRRKIASQILIDRVGELFPLINALVFPMNVVISPDLTIISITAGGISREQPEQTLR